MEEALNKGLENIGAIAILAILVYRLPNIITSINAGVQLIINSVQSVQEKALNVFKDQNDKDRDFYVARFEKIEESLEKMGNALETNMALQNKMLDRQNTLDSRLTNLEAEHGSNVG